MFKRYQHIHFVGIGGIGMSGIAEVLMNLGYAVSGSDLKPSTTTRRLKRRGAQIVYGHRAAAVNDAHVVVVSSAIHDRNPEIEEAKRRGVPVVPRAEMLAELMRLKYGIAVAGTHGKTTTTSLIAQVLAASGLDPTIVIGGRVNTWRTNARLGKGEFLVAEADESDRSFLKLTPTIAVVTNIDPEHMENYHDFDDMRAAYLSFANKVPFYGSVVCCMDHPEVRRLRQHCTRSIVTYGITEAADYNAIRIRPDRDRLNFTVMHRGKELGRVDMRGPGRHNVANALAAVAVARSLEIPFAVIAKALKQFQGIERRFQILHRDGPLVVNDYAHHPAELQATMQAARDGYPGRRLVVIHQPHRFTRLKALFRDFVTTLSEADVVLLMRVYAASETPLAGISSKKLWGALRRKNPSKPVHYAESEERLLEMLRGIVQPDDVVLFLGAGDIWKVATNFAKGMRPRKVKRAA